MRTADELEATILEASREIQNGIDAAGAGYRKLLPAITECAHEAYRTGGGNSVDDLMVHAGQDRIKLDIVALIIAVGMGDVLAASQGGKHWKAEPNFADRIEGVVNAGHLRATRGQPNGDPLSAYLHPGIKVHQR